VPRTFSKRIFPKETFSKTSYDRVGLQGRQMIGIETLARITTVANVRRLKKVRKQFTKWSIQLSRELDCRGKVNYRIIVSIRALAWRRNSSENSIKMKLSLASCLKSHIVRIVIAALFCVLLILSSLPLHIYRVMKDIIDPVNPLISCSTCSSVNDSQSIINN